MKTFDVNGNNDLFTGNDGNIAIVSGEPAVKNVCHRRNWKYTCRK